MMLDETLTRLVVALGIGLLVGLERGWRTRAETDRLRAAGIRTFTLTGLLGAIAALLVPYAGGVILGAAFVLYAVALTAFAWLQARAQNVFSVTTVVAAMATFLLAAYAMLGNYHIAVAASVAMTLVLAGRERMHAWVAALSDAEVRAVLILAAMSFLLLPFLPNEPVDPWRTINPHTIWLLAVLIAATSFAGYIAVRAFGDRLGVLLTGLAGGLASSTAATLAFARLGRAQPSAARLLAAGALVAGVVMMLRIGALVLVIDRTLLVRIAAPLAAAALVQALGALLLMWRSADRPHPELRITNPLAVGSAIKLAAFIAIVTVAAEGARLWIGDAGVLTVAGLSGIADVDAVTMSMATMAKTNAAAAVAPRAILLAAAVNTVSKSVMAGWTGGARLGVYVGSVSALALAAGYAALRLVGS